jgi:hypothetical protein
MTEINRFIENQRKHIAELQQLPLTQCRNFDEGEASWNDHGWVYTNQKGQRCHFYFVKTGNTKYMDAKGDKNATLLPDGSRHLLMAYACHIMTKNYSMKHGTTIHSKVRAWLEAVADNPARLTNNAVKLSLEELKDAGKLYTFFNWLAEYKLKPQALSLPHGLTGGQNHRVGQDIYDHKKTKLPEDKPLIALGAIAYDVIPADRAKWDNHSKTFQRDQFVCAMATLAMAAPNRVAAEQTVLHIQKLKHHTQESKGKEETISYLDWQGSKGYKNNRNHIAAPMATAVDRTMEYIMRVTEPARVLARFYAKPELPLKKVLGSFAPSQENLDFIQPDLSKQTDILRLGCLLGFFDGTERAVRVKKETSGAFRPLAKKGSCTYVKSIADIEPQDTLLFRLRCKYCFKLMGAYAATQIKFLKLAEKFTPEAFQAAWIVHIKKQFPAFPYANNNSSGSVDFRLAMFAFTGNQLTASGGYELSTSHFALVPLSTVGNIFINDIKVASRSPSNSNIFTRYGFSGEFWINPHQFRHYLDNAADHGGVPHKMINLWSGRVSPEQLLHYLHRTSGEKASEISGIMFKDEITPEKAVAEVSLRVKSQKEFEELTGSAAALHSTGVCTQNLVLSPCEYLNDFVSQCALCKSSCHIAHEADAIAFLCKDLEVQDRRLEEALTHKTFFHSQGKQEWFKVHHRNTEMLRQLLDVLRDPEIKAGSIVRVLSSKNEMRITNLETKTVEKRVMALASTEKALQRALQSDKDAENAIRDAHNSDLLALIGM